jgi:bacteriophage exclusion system BrxC/D-like protein
MQECAQAFGFSSWPFRIVVDPEFARVWADRATVLAEIKMRLRRLTATPHSTVQLMWADFGAGKSHTLRHTEILARTDHSNVLVPFYTEMPVGGDGLAALYRQLASVVGEGLTPEILEIGRRPGGHGRGGRDLRQALRLLAADDPEGRVLALDWLQGVQGVPNLRALKSYGIASRIEDDDRRLEVIRELVEVIQAASHAGATLWLIDEFQRVADLPPKKREALLKSIAALINSCPSGLHIMLSFSAAQQSAVAALLPPDLRSRASTFPMLTLPYLDKASTEVFFRDLFSAFRCENRPSPEWPFSGDALRALCNLLHESCNGRLTPRVVMERAGDALFKIYDRSDGKPTLPLAPQAVVDVLREILEAAQ